MVDFPDMDILALSEQRPAIVRTQEEPPSKIKAEWDQKAVLQQLQTAPPAPLTPYEKTAALAERRIGPAPGLEGIAVPSIN